MEKNNDMSSDRNINTARPLKPTLASTRSATPRTPLTPRIPQTSTPASTTPSSGAPRPTPRLPNRAAAASPRIQAAGTPGKEKEKEKEIIGSGSGSGNVTPRSSVRNSRVGGSSPAQDDPASDAITIAVARTSRTPAETYARASGASSLSLPSARGRSSGSTSVVSDNGSRALYSPNLSRSPGLAGNHSTERESIEGRFFHASEAARQEHLPKRLEPKKVPTFFYANGREDTPPKSVSPVLSAVNDQRPSGPWIKPDVQEIIPPKSPSVLSSALNSNTNNSYFPPTLSNQLRSPSPSKENIHLSYRKGVSQIFGVRPAPCTTPTALGAPGEDAVDDTRRSGYSLQHRKSTSLSSLNSNSVPRRRSNTAIDGLTSSPTRSIDQTGILSAGNVASPRIELPSIETLASPALIGSPSELALSPTKSVTQLAADARRERKVLDLEISNSSLLAINSSLEREVRRQKVELKRFRRLSRAGRFSMAPNERRNSGGHGILSEDDEGAEASDMLSGVTEDDLSDSEDEESLLSGSEPLSPSSQSSRQHDRLAKDDKRLQVDLQRHKELLVQSQAMNQSLKRCMYATQEMIREGRKALEYHVRVSDVKLGGRILTGDEDECEPEEIETADDCNGSDDIDGAQGVLGIWARVGRSGVESDPGDRDSGIEVDKPFADHAAGRSSEASSTPERPSRPPDDVT